jgi:hypothetical protein
MSKLKGPSNEILLLPIFVKGHPGIPHSELESFLKLGILGDINDF